MTYPYYILPQVETYRKLDPASEEARKIARFLRVNIGDIEALRNILGMDPPEFENFYITEPIDNSSSFDTIDAFLDKFGANLPKDSLDINPAVYVLEEEIDTPHEEIIEDDERNTPEEGENFGRLVKQHKYVEALKLIEAENLNNPQKSIYFAHQIRFLKKLINLENYKSKTVAACRPIQPN